MVSFTDITVSRAIEDTHIEIEINQNNHTESRNKLYIAYTNCAGDILEKKIKQIEKADLNRKYLLSWELINEITGRKKTQKGMIKVNNQK